MFATLTTTALFAARQSLNTNEEKFAYLIGSVLTLLFVLWLIWAIQRSRVLRIIAATLLALVILSILSIIFLGKRPSNARGMTNPGGEVPVSTWASPRSVGHPSGEAKEVNAVAPTA
jgi:hypothetical protein